MRQLVAIVSNNQGDSTLQDNQRRAFVWLGAAGISVRKVNGDFDPNTDRKELNELIGVSGISGQFPQFFIVDKSKNEINFFGLFADIKRLADSNELSQEALGLTDSVTTTDDAPFVGAPVEKFESEPKPIALAEWDTNNDEDPETPENPKAETLQSVDANDYESEEIEEEIMVDDEIIDDEDEIIEEVVIENEDDLIEHEEIIEDEEEGIEVEETTEHEEEEIVDSERDDRGVFVASKEDLFGDDQQDVENIASTPAPAPSPPPTPPPRTSSRDRSRDVEAQRVAARKRKAERDQKIARQDSSFHILIVVLLVLLIGAGVAVAYIFMEGIVGEKDGDNPNLGLGETTYMAPIQPGDCDFTGVDQPHVIDQCACNGEVSVIADDIRARYEDHLEFFVPTLYQSFEEPIESCTVRNQALLWLSSGNDFQFTYEERRQRFVLAVFFIALNGEEWTEIGTWLSTGVSCFWSGIECNAENTAVTEIVRGENNLSGFIPREVIFLQNLNLLALPNNKISGEIVDEIFSLRNLATVDMSSNRISGSLPSTIENATALELLNLDENSLTGTIPSLARARGLRSLKMGNNEFQTQLPEWLAEMDNLEELLLNNNRMIGSIPAMISNVTSLVHLNLGVNTFTDSLPTEIGELTNLQVLDLSTNLLTDAIPAEIGQLKNLTEFRLNENFFTGTLPDTISNMTKLEILTVDGNRILDTNPAPICELRTGVLDEFVVDCPALSGVEIVGVVCQIPTCCTECKEP